MYKETAEYAYDMLQHFYNINVLFVEEMGKDKIEMLVPEEIYKLLAKRKKGSDEIIYPSKFRDIDIVPYDGSTIDFVNKVH